MFNLSFNRCFAALCGVVTLCFQLNTPTFAGLVAYEGFDYGQGQPLSAQNGGLGWATPWSAATGDSILADSLSDTDASGYTLVTTGRSVFITASGGANVSFMRTNDFVRNSGTTWISLLALRGGNDFVRAASFQIRTNATERLAVGKGTTASDNTLTNWGLFFSGQAANANYSTNPAAQVSFLVIRVDHQPGNDNAYLFINPLLTNEPAIGQASAAQIGSTNFDFNGVRLFVGASGAGSYAEFTADEIRIGDTYADVTPFVGETEPPAPSGPLVITNVSLVPQGIVLSGSGGTNNGFYRVLAATDIAAPLTNWPAIATNTFDSEGNFVSTNPVSPGAARQFFALLQGLPSAPPPVGPSIVSSPTNRTVVAGEDAAFMVVANGDPTLHYQWFFNTNTPLTGATSPMFTVTNAQAANAGAYSVRVTNHAGAVTSDQAFLTVLLPPAITTHPSNQTVLTGNNATFNVAATGTPPLRYQWFFNTNTLLSNETNNSLTITAADDNDAGSYHVVVTNQIGSITSSPAFLTVTDSLPDSTFNLYGFGAPSTGGGIIADTDAAYRKVYTPGDFRLALGNNSVKVIEIMNDLNLGWNEIGATNQTGRFRSSASASMHPVLIASGVTTVDIQDKNGLTIFSANGATIRHAEFNLKRAHNIIIRNLKFDELWEWDEATKGDYDSKDWDFITIGDGGHCTNVWIDHCDFTKSYDGTVDIKEGDNNVTVSWCRFLADDGGPDSFVRRQFMHLETNGVSEAMFDFLRANGFSIDDIVNIARPQKKGHLAGANEFDDGNTLIKLTLHHNYYLNHQDRLPRLRGGNAHVYNVYLNNTQARAAKLLRDSKVAAIPGGLGSYKFDVVLNGAISTEDGAVLVEKCHLIDLTSPLRNNQVSAANAAYTGKIRAEDTINTLNGSTFRGDTEDPASTLVPVPAPLKPFSWNLPGNVLPYSYPVDDPSTLASLLGGNTAAGAGVLTWPKTNWLKTSY